MFQHIKHAIILTFGVIFSAMIYLFAHKKGKNAGKKAIIREHQEMMHHLQAKEESKHAVTQENIQEKLNRRFGGDANDL